MGLRLQELYRRNPCIFNSCLFAVPTPPAFTISDFPGSFFPNPTSNGIEVLESHCSSEGCLGLSSLSMYYFQFCYAISLLYYSQSFVPHYNSALKKEDLWSLRTIYYLLIDEYFIYPLMWLDNVNLRLKGDGCQRQLWRNRILICVAYCPHLSFKAGSTCLDTQKVT